MNVQNIFCISFEKCLSPKEKGILRMIVTSKNGRIVDVAIDRSKPVLLDWARSMGYAS